MHNRAQFICYSVLLAAHIALVWLVPYFPTQDGPSHVYNLVILHDLLHGGKEWGHYFSYTLHAVPNYGFEAIAYPLLHAFSPLVTEKLFISFYIILLGISVPLFLRTFGRPALPLAYLVFPVMFNFTLMMGFYSYVLAVSLCIVGISIAWKVRRKSTCCRFLVYNLVGVFLFYTHLIPFVYFLLALLAMTVSESVNLRKVFGKSLQLAIILSPSLFNLMLYFGKGSGNMWSSQVTRVSLDYLVKDLFYFSTVYFSSWQTLPASLLFIFVAIGAYVSAKVLFQDRRIFADIASESRTLLIFLAMLILIYFFAPSGFGGGSYFNERLPWVIFIVALPLLYFPETPKRRSLIKLAAMGTAGLYLCCNIVVFRCQSNIVEEFLRGLQAQIPKRAFVLTYNSKDSGWPRVDVLMHAAAYYGIFRGSVDVGNYETATLYFPVQFSPTVGPLPSYRLIDYAPAKIEWSKYSSIDYLIGWEVNSNEKELLGRYFKNIWNSDHVSIWQRNRMQLYIN